MSNKPHQLEIAEYIFVASSVIGSVLAAISGQVIYAAIPLSASLLLNLINRHRFDRLMRQSTNAAMVRVQGQLAEELQTLTSYANSLPSQRTTVSPEIQEFLASMVRANVNPVYRDVALLREQNTSLQNSLNSVVEYLNRLSLTTKVESLEQALEQLSPMITGESPQVDAAQQGQLFELQQRLQELERQTALSQGIAEESSEVDVVVRRQLEELKQQFQGLQHQNQPRQEFLVTKIEQLEQALAHLSEDMAGIGVQVDTRLQRCLEELQQQWQLLQSHAVPLSGSVTGEGADIVPPAVLPLPELCRQNWRCVHSFKGHSDWVSAMVVCPDGQRLISGSFDQTMKIWNLETGELIRTLCEGVGGIYAIALSPSSKILACGSAQQAIKLWNLETDQWIYTFWEDSGSVRSVALSPDGQTLANGSFDKTIKVWDIESREVITILPGHTGVVSAIAFSPDGKLLISGGNDGLIKVWDWNRSQLLQILGGDLGSIAAIALSPNGRVLASASSDRTVKLWHLTTGKRIHTLQGHTAAVTAIIMHPDGETLFSGSADSTIQIWQFKTARSFGILTNDSAHSVLSLALSSDGQTLVSGSADGTIQIWQRD